MFFVYRLIPPRPTFHEDMDARERGVMDEHARYWGGLLAAGRVVVYGPVLAANTSWGLGVVEADGEDEVRALISKDPAISSGVGTFELGTMLTAILHPSLTESFQTAN